MKEPLIGNSSRANRGAQSFVFLLFFLTLAFSTIIFYVSIQNYIWLMNDMNLVNAQTAKLKQIQANLIIVNATDTNATQTWERLNLTLAACEALQPLFVLEAAVLDNASYAINAYDNINASMVAFNTTCNDQIASLNKTLQELINATTEASTLMSVGECSFETSRVSFVYKQLQLNGVDFSYYLFTSRDPINVTNPNVTMTACSPDILATTSETYSFPVFEVPEVSSALVQPGGLITLLLNSYPIQGFVIDKLQIFTKFL